jgi:uncharacterized protein YqjF (DUF2071 family)
MTNFLNANWENIVMINYRVDPELLLPYVPAGCELDFYQGFTYVSLVGFMFKNSRLFQIPIPFFGTFEEINLRFYVTCIEGKKIKRGVVFINETIPYKPVAWVANKLYKEHYTSVPTKHVISVTETQKQINFQWQVDNQWNSIDVEASAQKHPMLSGSLEEFIFEHYYGYTKINKSQTDEYSINHPRWDLNKIGKYAVNCAFDKMYGENFSCLNNMLPEAAFLAEGSAVSVKWKRHRFTSTAK